MSHVPLPVRVAMGLVISAVEQARKLPEQLADLPVTAASKAVQAGMRVQQRVTELAIKGDQVFSLFRPVEDSPPWAKFDEDDPPPAEIALSSPQPPATSAGPGGTTLTPPALAGYDELSLAQLRGKLRGLSLPELTELLEYEHVHSDRPAFVTMLSNRISTVRSHTTESP
jgi:hypothetical protein